MSTSDKNWETFRLIVAAAMLYLAMLIMLVNLNSPAWMQSVVSGAYGYGVIRFIRYRRRKAVESLLNPTNTRSNADEPR